MKMKVREGELITFILPNLITLKRLKGYFDLIINTVSVVLDSNNYMSLLALYGTMVLVGLPETILISAF